MWLLTASSTVTVDERRAVVFERGVAQALGGARARREHADERQHEGGAPSCRVGRFTGAYQLPETKSNTPALVVMTLWLTTARPTYTEVDIGIVSDPMSVHVAPSADW